VLNGIIDRYIAGVRRKNKLFCPSQWERRERPMRTLRRCLLLLACALLLAATTPQVRLALDDFGPACGCGDGAAGG
jgi:hypothetical protein